jgi:hypothetical protein
LVGEKLSGGKIKLKLFIRMIEMEMLSKGIFNNSLQLFVKKKKQQQSATLYPINDLFLFFF